MADIRAFRGVRYDLGRVGNLSDVVCPPYDVIDDALQARLYDASPHNAVRLEWNRPEPGDDDTSNRYSRAAAFLRQWEADDVLRQDSARCLYVCHQEYEVDGEKRVRRGFLARVRLEPFGSGRIYPHEETMSGPKEDRLKLMRATAMNLSPIFGLYPDAESAVQEVLETATGRQPPLTATDHLGVVSRLWPVSDQQAVSRVTGLLGPKPVFIADGHHRYETALRYLDERREAGEVPSPEAPANFVMMMLVGMNEPGLSILPTHRLVRGIPAITSERLRALLGVHFDVESVGHGPEGARAAWETIQADGTQELLGFGTTSDGAWQVGRFKSPAVMSHLAADHSDEWRGLAVSVLHVFVLNQLLAEALGGQPVCRYVHLLDEVQQAQSANECPLAVLVPPAGMDHVEKIAGRLEKMPPKSTYFYPKLLTGLVFHSLKGNGG